MRLTCYFDRQKSKISPWRAGFSLVEGLVVIGIIALIVAIALPDISRILQRHRVQTAAQQLAINIRFARNAAVKQKINYRITIRNETHSTSPNTYFFEYAPARDNPPTYQTYTKLDVSIPDGVLIKSGSISQSAFDSRGRSSQAGAIRLEGEDGTQYEILITLNGGVTTTRI